jgi:outer membrane protein OmpA-like peptidoglycan-associated protein
VRCPWCGHEGVNPNAAFCGACGKPLSAAPSGTATTSTPGSVSPSEARPSAAEDDAGGSRDTKRVIAVPVATNHRKNLILGALGLAAVVAVGVVGALMVRHRPAGRSSANGAAQAGDLAPPPAPVSIAPISVQPTVTATSAVPLGRNIAAAPFGGEIENIRGAYGGPGLTGEALIDGSGKDLWTPDTLAPDTVTGRSAIIYPQEMVFSFYKRDTAIVSAVVVNNTDPGSGPRGIEVWTSMDSATGRFTQAAAARITDTLPVQTLSFTPVVARYVKVRIDSGPLDRLQIAQIQIIEGARPGYSSLLSRHPEILNWKTSVRYAAQRGVDWLEPTAMKWQHDKQCFGCHVQAQTMMGLSVAQANGYVVNSAALRDLAAYTRTLQDTDGHEIDLGVGNTLTPTQFAAMGMAYYDDAGGVKNDATLRRYVNWLKGHLQPTGELPQDLTEPPIAQGGIMATANSVVGFMQAYAQTGDSSYKAAADRGLIFIASDSANTTQDEVFAIIVLSRYGTPDERQVAARRVERLQSEQGKDGGWRETPAMPGSNAYATGQVLYALKEAGVSITSPQFSKGVHYLIANQDPSGSWLSTNTQSDRLSTFAPTMWAVIGLAGTVEPPPADSLKAELDRYGRLVLYINFDFNKATLRPDSKPIVAQVLKLLQGYPELSVVINGYTDNVGAHDYNVKLSQQRAAAVVAALEAGGVAAGRLSSGGFGPEQPLADNDTEKGRAKNRRVELIKQ